MKQKRKFKWKQFGAHLRQNRKAFGWGLREAARKTRTHHATFCRAEHGKPVGAEDFIYLCRWIAVDPADYLVELPS